MIGALSAPTDVDCRIYGVKPSRLMQRNLTIAAAILQPPVCLAWLPGTLAEARQNESAYFIDFVERTVDALVEHGRDRWGERKTAMIGSMLDRRTLAPLQRMPKGSAGVRGSDRTNRYGGNADR